MQGNAAGPPVESIFADLQQMRERMVQHTQVTQRIAQSQARVDALVKSGLHSRRESFKSDCPTLAPDWKYVRTFGRKPAVPQEKNERRSSLLQVRRQAGPCKLPDVPVQFMEALDTVEHTVHTARRPWGVCKAPDSSVDPCVQMLGSPCESPSQSGPGNADPRNPATSPLRAVGGHSVAQCDLRVVCTMQSNATLLDGGFSGSTLGNIQHIQTSDDIQFKWDGTGSAVASARLGDVGPTGPGFSHFGMRGHESFAGKSAYDSVVAMPTWHRTSSSKRRSSKTPQSASTGSNFCEGIVDHRGFEIASAVLILTHCIVIAWKVEILASVSSDPPQILNVIHYACSGLFLVEVGVKLAAYRGQFFSAEYRLWHIFEVALVGVVLLDVFRIEGILKTKLKIGKVLRSARMLRIFRILRFNRKLSVILAKSFNSIPFIFWVFILACMQIFSIAIIFTQGHNDLLYGAQHGDDFVSLGEEKQTVHQYFGSIAKSAYLVFRSICQGFLWSDAWDSLNAMGVFYAVLFVAFLILVKFAILNIISGIFIDVSLLSTTHERDLLQDRLEKENLRLGNQLVELFAALDKDKSGTITFEEFKDLENNPQMQVFLEGLHIDYSDVKQLFKLLDRDGNQEVDIQEFLGQCARIRGPAKSMDVHVLLQDARWFHRALRHLKRRLEGLHAELVAANINKQRSCLMIQEASKERMAEEAAPEQTVSPKRIARIRL